LALAEGYAIYRAPNVVERCGRGLKLIRALATRFEKTADAFLALTLNLLAAMLPGPIG